MVGRTGAGHGGQPVPELTPPARCTRGAPARRVIPPLILQPSSSCRILPSHLLSCGTLKVFAITTLRSQALHLRFGAEHAALVTSPPFLQAHAHGRPSIVQPATVRSRSKLPAAESFGGQGSSFTSYAAKAVLRRRTSCWSPSRRPRWSWPFRNEGEIP